MRSTSVERTSEAGSSGFVAASQSRVSASLSIRAVAVELRPGFLRLSVVERGVPRWTASLSTSSAASRWKYRVGILYTESPGVPECANLLGGEALSGSQLSVVDGQVQVVQ